jgi:hypothetical protein
MAVEPEPAGTGRDTSTVTSVLVALGALVAVVALVWGVGAIAADDDPTTAAVRDGAGGASGASGAQAQGAAAARGGGAAPTTTTTFDRLNTPVGHHGEYQVQYADLPAATRKQLDVAKAIIAKYPTAADAIKDGWGRATTNLKGIAAHYLRSGVSGFLGLDDHFDVKQPEILLFDGEGPDAPIVGLAYTVRGPRDPEGFAGKWDVWHRHEALCLAGGIVIGELDGHPDSQINMTAKQCADARGVQFPFSNYAMLHVWMKPGFASSAGVFSHDHPKLR